MPISSRDGDHRGFLGAAFVDAASVVPPRADESIRMPGECARAFVRAGWPTRLGERERHLAPERP
jgi:hypothetical protein